MAEEEATAATGVCHRCGQEAPHVCAGCQAVTYCSQKCLRADWRQHKRACYQKRLRPIVTDLWQTEVQWLKGLPRRVKEQLTECGEVEAFTFNHHLHFVPFALVLGGLNPCHYHDVQERRKWPGYTDQFMAHVLQPWFTRHEEFLERKMGFHLSFFTRELEFCPCGPLPRQYITDCQNSIVLKPGPLFWNSKHAEADNVRKIFFLEEEEEEEEGEQHSSEEKSERDDEPQDYRFDTLRKLGMTSSFYSFMRQPDLVPVKFDLINPHHFFDDPDACCSIWLLRATDNERVGLVGEYFYQCQKTLAKFDIPIRIEISVLEIEEIGCNLSPAGYAKLVVAGTGGADAKAALDLLESIDAAKETLSRQQQKRTKRFIREYCQAT